MAQQKTFKSIEEVVKRYWPKELQQPESIELNDPGAAGDALGRRVVETFGRELALHLERSKPSRRKRTRPSLRR